MTLSHRQSLSGQRLTKAVLLPKLMRQLKGELLADDDDPGQLADLYDLIKSTSHFQRLGLAMHDGDNARFNEIWAAVRRTLPPRGHHHLALVNCRWGWQGLARSRGGGAGQANRRWSQALEHFMALMESSLFFEQMASACGAPDRAMVLERDAPMLWLKPHLDAVLCELKPETALHRAEFKAHWQLLERAGRLKGVGGDRLREASLQAQRDIFSAVERHVNSIAESIDPTSADKDELGRPFEYLKQVVDITGVSESISVWAIEKCVEWAWPIYKSSDLERMQGMVELCQVFGEHLEQLLLTGDGAFGRNGRCATYLLFLADFREGDDEEAILERSLKVCQGHRNSRLMLSYSRLRRANVILSRLEVGQAWTKGGKAARKKEADMVEAIIESAAELFPANEKLSSYQERLEKVKQKLE